MIELPEVHIGTFSPGKWDEIEQQQASFPADSRQRRTRPRIASNGISWPSLGLVPQWVGDDTSCAVAAFEYCRFDGEGADEWQRFWEGAKQRDELALLVSTIGELESGSIYDQVLRGRPSVEFPYVDTFRIVGEEVRLSRPPLVQDDLTPSDRDLALRIANDRSLNLPWWRLRIGVDHADRDGNPMGFFGTWQPILVTPAGEVVAGVWTDHESGDPEAPRTRHYVLPALESHTTVLEWFARSAVPDLLPGAARRSRSYVHALPGYQTSREQALHNELDELETEFRVRSGELRLKLAEEQGRADVVREPLLFASGSELVDAVAAVLRDAGAIVRELDAEIGTKSADLLVTFEGTAILVEVKSAAGNANESIVDSLRRHLRTWPQLMPGIDISGGALVVNHQRRMPPGDRRPKVFTRSEFIDSLELPTCSTLELFHAWKSGDRHAVRAAIGLPAGQGASVADAPAMTLAKASKFRWFGRRG